MSFVVSDESRRLALLILRRSSDLGAEVTAFAGDVMASKCRRQSSVMQLHRRRAPYHLDVGGLGGKRNMCRVGGWTRSEGEINMARLAGSISLAGASSGGPLTSVSSLMTVGRCLLNNVVFAGDAPRDHTHINTTADRSRERGQLTDMLVRRPKLGKNGRILSRVVRRLSLIHI